MTRTYYDVLEVDPDAGRAAVQRAYRRQVRRYHPDASDHPDADERIKEVNRAREVLADPEERQRYDRLGHEAYVREEELAAPSTPAGNTAGDGGRHAGAGAAGADPGGDAGTGAASGHAGAAAERPAVEGETADGSPFAFREFVSAVLLSGLVAAGVVAASGYLGTVAPADRPVDGSVLFVLAWAGVAVVAGELAAGGAGVLPRNSARAFALPVGLVAVAWLVRGGMPAVAALLALYGAYAALFRGAAAAGRGRRSLAPAAVWFVGTVAPALALYDRLFPVGGIGRDVGHWAMSLAAEAGAPLSTAVASPLSLAVSLPLATGVGYGLATVLAPRVASGTARLRSWLGSRSDAAGGTGSSPSSGSTQG